MSTLPRPSAVAARRPATLSRWTPTLVTAVVAIALRALLQPLLGDRLPFVIAYPAVVLAASLWGIAPGVFVAFACAMVTALPAWISPTLDPADRPMHLAPSCSRPSSSAS